ncbi:MAG: Dabb family protein, partial [Balneolaceae bacterium]
MKVILRIGTLLLAMFFLVACQPEEDQSIEDHEDITTVGMLQHIVYFYLNEDVTAEEKTDFEEGLNRLLSIEEVYFYQVGIPGKTADRDVTDHDFGYSISSWFQTMDEYEVYAEHPVHLEFIDDY